MDTIFRIGRFCEKLMHVIAVIFMAFIPVAIIIQVIFRTLNVSVNWSEEAARFAYVAVTFLGSVLAVKHGKHIVINFLFDMLPPAVQRALGVIMHLVMAFFMVLCTHGSVLLISAAKSVRSNSMLWFRLNYLYGFVLVCCIVMVLVCIIRAFEYALDKVKPVENLTGGAI